MTAHADDGLIEAKSRKQRFQIENIVDFVSEDKIMPEFMLQVQTGLLVSEREWCDHISYSGGLSMTIVRVHPDEKIQEAVLEGAHKFEKKIAEKWDKYREVMASKARLIPTERHVEQEMFA